MTKELQHFTNLVKMFLIILWYNWPWTEIGKYSFIGFFFNTEKDNRINSIFKEHRLGHSGLSDILHFKSKQTWHVAQDQLASKMTLWWNSPSHESTLNPQSENKSSVQRDWIWQHKLHGQVTSLVDYIKQPLEESAIGRISHQKMLSKLLTTSSNSQHPTASVSMSCGICIL